ncbi:MFS transporter [Rhodococcus sp. 15-649-1-2]|nr:MFS transporter [Rhodococcus sp. 06-418-1B]OZE80247.1 MFS transporter [Rhodococcus sp. 15-649-1-2]
MGASFMHTIVIPIQSELPELLDADRSSTAWVITITLLVSAVSTPISGKLGDMFGKRRVALVLLALLVGGSIVAAFSYSVVPLIVGRGLQGTGMGVIPLGIAILRDTVPPRRLGSAIALVSATLGVGGALGLPLSAYVTERFDWHVLFGVAAGIGVLSFVLVYVVVPASASSTGGRLDVVGALGLSVGVTGLLIAVSGGNEWGWVSTRTLVCAIGALVVFAVWGWFELRVHNPLVDLRVSVRATVLMTNLSSVAMGFALFSSSIVFPQLLQLPVANGGLGLSLQQASFVLMPAGIAMLAMSPIAGRLERRIGAKPLLVAGAFVIAIGYSGALIFDVVVWHLALVNLLIGVGIGLGFAAMPTLIMAAVPDTETAAANGLNTLMRGLGTSFAAAVAATILSASSTSSGDASVPGESGFQLAIACGLIAALMCAAIAALIRRPAPNPEERAALPDGVL